MIREEVRRALSAGCRRWGADPRLALAAIARHHGYSLADLSTLVGRERSYLARFVRQGVPRALRPDDHQRLCDFFGVGVHGIGIRDLWVS